MSFNLTGKVSVTVEAVKILRDGTRIDLGVISRSEQDLGKEVIRIGSRDGTERRAHRNRRKDKGDRA